MTSPSPRVVATPFASTPPLAALRRLPPRRVPEPLVATTLPGPGRDRLAAGEVLVVTTGQQPGLFTGPLYTIYKALSAIAQAARLEREWGVSVVPVFWVAGDDHDFHEANHATVLNAAGMPTRIVLRERPADAPAAPMSGERGGPEILDALARLRDETPESEFKGAVLAWLEAAYRPEASLADAFAYALNDLLGPRGLAVTRPYAQPVKQAMAPWLLRGPFYPMPIPARVRVNRPEFRGTEFPPARKPSSLSLMTRTLRKARSRTGSCTTFRRWQGDSRPGSHSLKCSRTVHSRVIPAPDHGDGILPVRPSGRHTGTSSGCMRLTWILPSRPRTGSPSTGH